MNTDKGSDEGERRERRKDLTQRTQRSERRGRRENQRQKHPPEGGRYKIKYESNDDGCPAPQSGTGRYNVKTLATQDHLPRRQPVVAQATAAAGWLLQG